jgi:hypothetical protein
MSRSTLSRSVIRRLRKQGKTVKQLAKLFKTTSVTLYRNYGATLKATTGMAYAARRK